MNSREFNHKIKGIGHSSFTPAEVTQLRSPTCGNEAVNAIYLANYNSRNERMKAPHNNTDLQHLRSWIQKKYIDKLWCDKEKERDSKSASSGSTNGGAARSPNRSKPKSNNETGRRKIMPNVKEQQQPAAPAPAASTQPPPDLFGFDSIVATSTNANTTNNNDNWDAFGGSTQNQSDPFDADFSGMNSTPAASVSAPAPPSASAGQVMVHCHPQLGDQGFESTLVAYPPATPAPANNFTNFGGQQQHTQPAPTMVSMPPPTPLQQQMQQQPTFQANFGQAPAPPQMQMQPQQQMQPPQQQMQPPQQHTMQQQSSFQANFDQAPPTPQQQQVQIQPPQQPQGFANVPSVQQTQPPQPQMQMQPQLQNNDPQGGGFATAQPQQQPQQEQQTAMGLPSSMQGGNMMMNSGMGGMPNSNIQPPPQQLAQKNVPQMNPPPQQLAQNNVPQMNNQQQDGNNNFGQFPQRQLQMQQQPEQQIVQSSDGFANFSSVQPPGQQQMTMQSQPNIQAPSQPTQHPGMAQPTHQVTGAAAGNTANNQQTTMQPPEVSSDEKNDSESAVEVNPNAFNASVDSEKKDAFGAFDGLSLEPTPSAYMGGGSEAATDAGGGNAVKPSGHALSSSATSKDLNFAPFREGQQVMYTNGEGSCLTVITKVHFDDELHPYYTININGRQKQTDNAHLSLPDGSSQVASNNNVLLQETTSMLQKLNPQQLMQVQQLVINMLSSSSSMSNGQYMTVAPPSSGQNVQMNGVANHHQNQMSFGGSFASTNSSTENNTSSVAMGGAPPTPPTPQMQFVNQQGIQMPQQQYQNHVPQQQQMPQQPQMGMGMMPQQNQMPQQQQMSMGMPAQQMGMGMGAVEMPLPPPPSEPPTAPQQQSMGMGMMGGQAPQMSFQQAPPHQPMAAAAAPPDSVPPPQQVAEEPAPAPPALPPVEKEGNPFDFY